ncbi:tripartite tricarboxylate transporter TctB family protein [Pontitalea aquivivens]|uniref:tripartite tricarboxylate transporter TctB family protein n=1 Tax=Pontitalea aquivivens TaxID=3388663 RepID=UPI003970D71B
MNRDIANIVSGVVLALGSAGLYLYTVSAGYRMGGGVAYDAGLMPRLWLAIGGLGALGIAIRGLAGLRCGAGAANPLARIASGRLVTGFGLTALFLVGFGWLGFWLPILAFVPVFSVAFGYRNPVVIAVSTFVFAGLTWLVFAVLLEVQMTALPDFLHLGG